MKKQPAPPCEIVRLPTKGPGAHKGAAAFFAVISYPWDRRKIGAKEKTRRLRCKFVDTAMAWFIRYQLPKSVKKQFKTAGSPWLKIPTRQIDRGPLTLADKRIQKKMTAGRMMGRSLMLGQTRKVKEQNEQRAPVDQYLYGPSKTQLVDNGPAFTIEGKEATLNEVARFAVKLGMETDQRNAKERIWEECKPVLHLIMALGSYLDEMPQGKKFDILDLIANPSWLEPVLLDAERLRTVFFPLLPGMSIDPEDTIQVLPNK